MPLDVGDILLGRGVITRQQLDDARATQHHTGDFIGNVLIASGVAEEREVVAALSEQYALPIVHLKESPPSTEVIQRVPAKFVRHYHIMPVQLEGLVLTVAFGNPADSWAVDDLQTSLGLRVRKVLSLPSQIQEAIEQHYGVGAATIERILDEDRRGDGGKSEALAISGVEDLERLAGDASVVRLVNEIIQQAISERATDIHLETFPEESRLRYRVDGLLRDARVSGDIRFLYLAIISRIKIMSGLDIIERRVPQDGRAKVKVGVLEYDLRISIMPTIYGENVVIRILPTSMLFSMGDLGMNEVGLKTLQRLIESPNGIIFVTGPTGSGKSTSLYASLKRLNRGDIKLVTIEDPVEYALRGVSQVQVNIKTGMTFARALRSMLRHDPDVIMIGEIRDLETASIAVRAALTGHLVLSTIHTNNAAGGAPRLIDIGIEPYLITSSVLAFVGQRLIRVVCKHCREQYQLPPETVVRFGRSPDQIYHGYRGRGCEVCGKTGYKGRTGIYEILEVGGEIRKLILEKASGDVIADKARLLGIPSMLDDGFEKVLAGLTTPEEVLRVTHT